MLDTRTLLDLADKPYLLPLILWSCSSTLWRAIPRFARSFFSCMAEVVNYWYEFRAQCTNGKARWLGH